MPALPESGFYIGVQNAWRLANERGTRDTLHGPFLHDYFNSITSLRGWGDGDGLFTSYIGHPMEGAVFGFVQQQNDPRYQTAEFRRWAPILDEPLTCPPLLRGDEYSVDPRTRQRSFHRQRADSRLAGFRRPSWDSDYGCGLDGWRRCHRPVSHLVGRKPYANPVIIMLVRGFGNPTRSMAKLMQTKVPWARDSRPSNWGENRILHAELLRSVPEKPAFGQRAVYHYRSSVDGLPIPQETRDYPVEAPIELMAAAHYEWFVYGGSCVGGGGTGSARINPNWQFVAEVTGCMLMGIQAPQSGDSLTYMIGPRWTRELRTACRPMCSSC